MLNLSQHAGSKILNEIKDVRLCLGGDDKMTFNECGFQERIKALRKQKGYTQQQLADIFCVSKFNVNYYEKTTRAPSPDIFIKYADEFNVSIDYLFGREKPSGNMVDVSGLSKEEVVMIQNMIDTLRNKNK